MMGGISKHITDGLIDYERIVGSPMGSRSEKDARPEAASALLVDQEMRRSL